MSSNGDEHVHSPVGRDPCSLQRRWLIRADLARDLVRLDQWADDAFSSRGVRWPGLTIISGYRSLQRQLEVNPSVPNSLHTRCPALAVDLILGGIDLPPFDQPTFDWLGHKWISMWNTWGGKFDPPDINHFAMATV